MRVLPRIFLVLLLLSFTEARLCAASAAENSAFRNATDSFNNGWWERAEKQFAEFAKKYPKSDRHTETILNAARARLKQNNFDGAARLLSDNIAEAGNLAHEFQFWLAEAHFQNSNFAAAAEAYAKLTGNFPDSTHFLESSYDEALARSRLNDWPAVIKLLNQPGAFMRAAQSNPTNEFVILGNLLLAAAQHEINNFSGEEQTLQNLRMLKPRLELDWRRQSLLCRLRVAEGRLPDALQEAKSLLEIARATGRPGLISESMVVQADILEQLNRADEAIAMLENFLKQNPTDPAADVAVLTVGELKLKDYFTTNSTNLLVEAQSQFDRLIGFFTNSQHVAKARLDRGWCFWLGQKIPESLADFTFAAGHLPFSKEQAVARFKMGDCQFALGDFSGALTNYSMVATGYASLQFAQNEIIEPALYQIVRAAIKSGNDTAATNALKKILVEYPDSFITERATLLVGQNLNHAGNSAGARNIFADYLARSSSSTLLPEIQLAVARTYEHEAKWIEAIEIYNAWLATFTNHTSRVRAEFDRAWANDHAGNETNAFTLFTNFVSQYTNEMTLAPLAQFWIGDHFFHLRDYQNAEISYKKVFQKWPLSPLRYEASMMAGLAAIMLDRPDSAMENFARLFNDPDCPPEYVAKALYAAGDALTTTNNFTSAITLFQKIPQLYKTNDIVPLALGRIADCYLQLAANDPSQYANATNFYQMVLDAPRAGVTARSQAEFGIADALEKLAEKQPEAERKALLKSALNHYQNVCQLDLSPGERPDPVWVGKAQRRIAKLEEPTVK